MIAQDPDIPRPLGIVEKLREIQERLGWLPHEEMENLSRQLSAMTGKLVPLHRIHEVASFYPLYRLQPPPVVDVRVCQDMACHTHGAPGIIRNLQASYDKEIKAGQVFVGGVSCLGQCDNAVACMVNDHHYYFPVTEKSLRDTIQLGLSKQKLPHQHLEYNPLPWKIDVYKGKPTYEAVKRVCSGELKI